MRRNIIISSVVSLAILFSITPAAQAASGFIGAGGTTCFANSTATEVSGRVYVNQVNRVKGELYQTVKVRVNVAQLSPDTQYSVSLASVAQLGANGNPAICFIDQVGSFTTNARGRGRLAGTVSGVQISDDAGRDFQVIITGSDGTVFTSTALLNELIRN
jgi:hypothetical protein